jgi:flagellar protein FliO/FliZ
MEFLDYLRFLAALMVVLGLIGACAWAARRFGLAPGMVINRRSEKRLAIVENLALDARRRLVIVRRDGVEHLILLGATSETVVEAGFEPRAETIIPLETGTEAQTPRPTTGNPIADRVVRMLTARRA